MTDQSVPGAEPPLFLETVHTRGGLHEYRSNLTAVHRQPVDPRLVWNSMAPADIPTTNPVPEGPNADGDAVGFVTLRKQRPLTQGAANAATGALVFTTTPAANLSEVIPATWGAGSSYRPVLRDSTAAIVPYDPQVWIVDGVNSTVEFPQNALDAAGAPPGLPAGTVPPYTLTFWRYNGVTGGAGGGGEANDGANIGGGVGIYDGKVGVTLNFKTLVAGNDISLDNATNPDEIIINAEGATFDVTQVAHGFSVGEVVFLDDATALWTLAQADDVHTLGTHLVAIVADVDNFSVTNNGPFAFPGHGLGAIGTYLYVSAATAGGLVSAEPALPNYSNPIAQVLTLNDLLVLPYRASQATAPAGAALGTAHLKASDVQFASAGVTVGAFGFATVLASAAHAESPGVLTRSAWATATPPGFAGVLPTVRVVFASPSAGTAAVRLGFQDLGSGAAVAASAPTMVGAYTAATVAAPDTAAEVALTAPAIGGLAGSRPFLVYVERDSDNGADDLADTLQVHSIFLAY